jgi:transcriptional regulator with XRE-family HTH domain
MIRAIRQRKRWRQIDVATRARVSQTLVSRVERGAIANVPVGTVRRIADALDARIDLMLRWRGGELDRLIGARHAGMHEAMARMFASLGAWEVEPEVSFSVFGERGVIDIVAWHAATRSMLIVELKTELVDVNEMMSTLDRKRRLGRLLERERGWQPSAVSSWVVLVDSRTNRRTVANHAAVLRSKQPADGRTMAAWLRHPSTRVDALTFLSSNHGAPHRRDLAPIRRVNRPAPAGRSRT